MIFHFQNRVSFLSHSDKKPFVPCPGTNGFFVLECRGFEQPVPAAAGRKSARWAVCEGAGESRHPTGAACTVSRYKRLFCLGVPRVRTARQVVEKHFFDLMQHLQPIEWFVGNGLDRSVLPCQKHDTARKPRAIRRDFMRCARPDVRMGHCARRRVSERNRRTAAALSAEIDPFLQIFPASNFFCKLKRGPLHIAAAPVGVLCGFTAFRQLPWCRGQSSIPRWFR